MFTESRKIQLLEEVIREKNEEVLHALESVLKRSKPVNNASKGSAHDLLGVWSKKDAALIEKAINEGCEQIDIDGWK